MNFHTTPTVFWSTHNCAVGPDKNWAFSTLLPLLIHTIHITEPNSSQLKAPIRHMAVNGAQLLEYLITDTGSPVTPIKWQPRWLKLWKAVFPLNLTVFWVSRKSVSFISTCQLNMLWFSWTQLIDLPHFPVSLPPQTHTRTEGAVAREKEEETKEVR